MINNDSFEIISFKKVIIRLVLPLKLNYDHEAMERIWRDICSKKSNKLFNSKVLTFHDSYEINNMLIVKGSFLDYKIVISTRKEPSLGLKIKQIGVSGIIIVNDNNEKYILFATRSPKTTEYPGFIELVPSGNIDESVVRSDGTIDYISKIKEEFSEETGLELDSIDNIANLCFVKDKLNQVYDICCLINIKSSKENILEKFERVSEYIHPKLVPLSSLTCFIEENYKKIIPTSLAILSNF